MAVWKRFEKINGVPRIVPYLPWLAWVHGWQYEPKQRTARPRLGAIYDKLHRQHEEQYKSSCLMKCLDTHLLPIVVNPGLKVTHVGIVYNLGGLRRLKKTFFA